MNRSQKRKVSKKDIRVLIGMPSTGIAPTDFGISLARMLYFCGKYDQKIEPVLVHSQVNPLDRARNELVTLAKDYDCEYLLFLDTDMVVPQGTLQRLMDHNKGIVGCNYPRRDRDLAPTAKGRDGKKLNPVDQGLIAVMGLPTGCLLIKTEVFNNLKFPWFRFELNDKDIMLSEDYYFCNKARRASYEIFCDTSLSRELIHIGQERYQFT